MLNLYTYNMGNGNLDATKHARSLSVRAVSKKFRHFSSILFFVFANTTLYHGFISCIPSPRFNFSPPISTRLPHSPPQTSSHLLFMRGPGPQTPHTARICELVLFLQTQKDAHGKTVYKNDPINEFRSNMTFQIQIRSKIPPRSIMFEVFLYM